MTELINFSNKSLDVFKQTKYIFQGNTYTIFYNGTLYNLPELKSDLISSGFYFDVPSRVNNIDDSLVLIACFIKYGYDMVEKLNGAYSFAIWNENKNELFLVRDHFGIKPLYYTLIDNTMLFSANVKDLFKDSRVEPILNKQGMCELFGLGPAHTSGFTPFKNIFELKPAHFTIYNHSGLKTKKYWQLKSMPHKHSIGKTCEIIRDLLKDSIQNQINVNNVQNTPSSLCTFLSGGLDSSIVTFYTANFYKEHDLGPLNTYSVDYIDNDKNFVKTDFQPNSDSYFIKLAIKRFGVNHKTILLDTPDLANSLKDSIMARGFPGMADIDSSLLLFCKKVQPHSNIALTGECADEFFCGYPWFFREDCLSSKTFPWSMAIKERQNLLSPDVSSKIDLQDYIDYRYTETLKNVPRLEDDSPATAKMREITYLTLNWFMQTLIDRADKMASYSNMEIRVPFCDYRLAQYVWNIPWELKTLKGREKGLLRYAMKGLLPSEIIDRKKSPYPKTCNPTYLTCVKNMLSNIINNSQSPINYLIDKNYVQEILDTDGRNFTHPWFGQLMTGPQLMAYLCQINMWLEEYNPKIEI